MGQPAWQPTDGTRPCLGGWAESATAQGRCHDRSDHPASARHGLLAYHQAWTSQDLDQAMTYIAEGITCDAPSARICEARHYREFLGGFMAQLTGVQTVAVFGDDGTAVLFYYPGQRRVHRRVLHRHRRKDHPQRARL